jgi:hypothetical protein
VGANTLSDKPRGSDVHGAKSLRPPSRDLLRVYERALGQARVASSGLSRSDHFANTALRIAGEERPDVLSHPGSANLARDTNRVLGGRELEDQDQVRLIDLRDTSRERACIDHKLHPVPRRLDGSVGHRFAQTEVVDDNVQQLEVNACSAYLLRDIPGRWRSRRVTSVIGSIPRDVRRS